MAARTTTAVVTDELYAAAKKLQELSLEANSIYGQLISIAALVSGDMITGAGNPQGARRASSDIHQAIIVMEEINITANLLGNGLAMAAGSYDMVEKIIGSSKFGKLPTGIIAPLIPVATYGGPGLPLR